MLLEEMQHRFQPKKDYKEHVIYLRVRPEVNFKRIQTRGRAEEMGVPLEYFCQLHQLLEDWLLKETDMPVTTIDAERPHHQVYADVLTTIERLGL